MDDFIKRCLDIPTETRKIEFKRLGEKKVVKKIIETVVAMANTDGGIIVLGIDDPDKKTGKTPDERIFGIEENFERFDEIGRELKNIIPNIPINWPPEIKGEYSDDIHVVGLVLPKVTEAFCSYKNHVFVRLEKGNKTLSPVEIINLSYAKGFFKSDSELVDVDFELLDTPYYEDWKNSRGLTGKTIEDNLYQTGLAKKDSKGELIPKKASVLLFANYPNDLLSEKTSIKISQYEGTLQRFSETPNMIGVPKIINGPVIQQIQDAQDYVLTLLRTGIRLSSGFLTQYQIPERPVKEAITNAVIHRDYHSKRDIEIRLFEDRIEVDSPGLLPYNITPENIGFVRADDYRNDLLVKHLREFPVPPNLDQNEGVRAMRAEMKRAQLYPPIYWTYPNLKDSVQVILFNESIPSEWEKVEDYLQSGNVFITNAIVRKITGVKDSPVVSRLLSQWTNKGLLVKVIPLGGGKKGVKYLLKLNQQQETLFENSHD